MSSIGYGERTLNRKDQACLKLQLDEITKTLISTNLTADEKTAFSKISLNLDYKYNSKFSFIRKESVEEDYLYFFIRVTQQDRLYISFYNLDSKCYFSTADELIKTIKSHYAEKVVPYKELQAALKGVNSTASKLGENAVNLEGRKEKALDGQIQNKKIEKKAAGV